MNNEFNFQTNPYQGFNPPETKKKNSFAIASLVLGIVAVVACCCCCCSEILGFLTMGVCGVLAIVFAFISKSKSEDKKMDGKAIAGLVLGIVALVMLLLFLVLTLGSFAMFGSMTEEEIIAYFDQNLKPYVDEATYNQFIESFKQGYAAGSGQ